MLTKNGIDIKDTLLVKKDYECCILYSKSKGIKYRFRY